MAVVALWPSFGGASIEVLQVVTKQCLCLVMVCEVSVEPAVGRLGGLNAVWCGVGGIAGGWARLTKSSPDESDSLSDSGIWWSLSGAGINCVNFDLFTGNRVSLNFTSREISNCWWAASQNWYPLEPDS